jgi:acetyl esterase/lipase
MSVIELTTFVVAPEKTAAMLAARPGMLRAFREDRRGFVAARLIRLGSDTWLDLVEWTDDSAWDASKEKGANRPEIAAFFATIDRLVSAERGARYDDEQDGPRSVRTIAYGPEPSQVGELYLPPNPGPHPVVVLVHGGYWCAMFDRRQLTALADDLVRRGYAVWNVEYRRIGEPGGGWPGTFQDVADAIDAVADLDPALDTDRVTVVGHSAGGHLAVWTAHRAALPESAPGANPRITPVGAVSLAGILDLTAGDATRMGSELSDPDAEPPRGAPPAARPEVRPAVAADAGEGVVRLLLGGRSTDVPGRYAAASPKELPDTGVPRLIVHGAADDVLPPANSRSYADAAIANGADVRYLELPGADHFDVIDPDGAAWAAVLTWLDERLAPDPDTPPAVRSRVGEEDTR